MDPHPTTIKEYKRRTGKQHLITLKKGHHFQKDQSVYVVDRESYDRLERINKTHEKLIQAYTVETQDLKEKVKNLEKQLRLSGDKYQTHRETLQRLEVSYTERITSLKEDLTRKDRECNELKAKYDKQQDDLTSAMQWIGISWGVLRNLQGKNRLQILLGGLGRAVDEVPRPSHNLLPAAPVEDVINE